MSLLNVCLTSNDLFKVFVSSSCLVCLKHVEKDVLFKCQGCKCVFYCSKKHQKEHWPKHESFCKLVKAYMEKEGVPAERFFMPVNGCNSKWFRSITLLKTFNPLLTFEDSCLLLFPYVCNTCGIYKTRMIHCPECHIIAYCSGEHLEQDKNIHTLYCWRYKPYLEYEKCCAQRFLISVDILCNHTSFPSDMKSFTEKAINIKTIPTGRETHGIYFISNSLSLPLTLIYAIEKSNVLENKKKTTLALSVVDAFTTENHAWWVWEYLFHYFKQLKTLILTFVSFHDNFYFPRPVLKCRNCRLFRNILFKVIVRETRENVTSWLVGDHATNGHDIPDIIFNPSNSFPWDYRFQTEARRAIFKPFINIPKIVVVLSSSTYNDAVAVRELVMSICRKDAKFFVELKKNPYSPLLCIPNWEDECGNECMNNNYLTIMKT